MIDEQPDAIPLPTTPEEAYLQAKAGAEIFGMELQPWSPARVVAANAMGLGWPLPPEAAEQLNTTGLYAGAIRDTIIVTWLRTLPNASEQPPAKRREWNVQRATREPLAAFEAAMQWATECKLTELTSETTATAYKHMLAALLGVAVSEFDPEPPPDSKPDKGEGIAPNA